MRDASFAKMRSQLTSVLRRMQSRPQQESGNSGWHTDFWKPSLHSRLQTPNSTLKNETPADPARPHDMLAISTSLVMAAQLAAAPQPQIGGALQIAGKPEMLCPLKATKVRGNVYGPAQRVTVEQTFANPSKDKIEAVYTFPLPENAAVDRMTFRIGDRVIQGEIKRREEAEKIYNDAKTNGQAAALLNQDRPNLFVQSVANIPAGASVKVEISYVNMLKFEDGQFEISFPMVAAPRFGAQSSTGNPAYSTTKLDTKLDLAWKIDAGTKIIGLKSDTHALDSRINGEDGNFRLKNADEIPNRDLVVRYEVGSDGFKPAMVTSWDAKKGGHFCFMLLPPKAPTAAQISPRDVMLVMDQSGSQSGFAIERSKELTLKMLDRLRPQDTFNVFGFNTEVKRLFPISVPPTDENLRRARAFVSGMQANGGTYVKEGVVAALSDTPLGDRLKMVLFNTDGLVGNEKDVLEAIIKHRGNARMFNFGIGNSVNRFLLDAMTVEGRGDIEYVTQGSNLDEAVRRFAMRTETPTLINVNAQFSGDVDVSGTSPAHLPDLFGQRPIIIFGKFKKAGPVQIQVTGDIGGEPWTKNFKFDLTDDGGEAAVPTLWARSQVDDLTRRTYVAEQLGREANTKAIQEAITKLGLDYRIMTNYTSFVAVDRVRQPDGRMVTVPVPVNAPAGMDMMAGSMLAGKSRGGSGGGFGAGSIAPGSPVLIRQGDAELVEKLKSKVDPSLATATGKVKISIYVIALSKSLRADLEKLGLKVTKADEKGNRYDGEIDASKVADLAKIADVIRIQKRDK